MVMPIGTAQLIPSNLHGFALTKEIKLLGADISNDWRDLEKNFLKVVEKIENLIRFWERFRLTLPGRIAIIKTLLVPQLNYLGCVLTPSDRDIARIQTVLDSFALKGLTVSSDRRYLLPEQGGLGLFRIDEFIFSQKCSWIKRAFSNQNDNWRLTIRTLAPGGKIDNLRSCDIDPNVHIILYDIVSAFELFVSCFSMIDNNFRKNSIFLNGAFQVSGNDPSPLGISFFGKAFYESNALALRSLTFEDCFIGDNFKSINEFHEIGLPFPYAVWMRLRSSLLLSKKKLSVADKVGKNVVSFLRGFKKGSKPFRLAINRASYIGESTERLTIVNSFANITNTNVQSTVCLPHILSSWNRTFLDNHLREFIFHCRNNSLRTKNRLSHFLQLDDSCNFCLNVFPDFRQRETFPHIFRKCTVTSNVLNTFLRQYSIVQPPSENSFDEFFWYGTINHATCKPSLLIFDIFRYCIWVSKLRCKIPRNVTIHNMFGDILRGILNRKRGLFQVISGLPHIAGTLRATG
jgi:hypothetical protein